MKIKDCIKSHPLVLTLMVVIIIGVPLVVWEQQQHNTFEDEYIVSGEVIDVLYVYRRPPVYPMTSVIFENGDVVKFDWPTYWTVGWHI